MGERDTDLSIATTLAAKLPNSEAQLKQMQQYLNTLEQSIVKELGSETLEDWKQVEREWKRKVLDIHQHGDLVSPYEVPDKVGK